MTAHIPIYTDTKTILAPLSTYPFINNAGYFVSVLAPLVENDKFIAALMEGDLADWAITTPADNALTFDYADMRLKINYQAFADGDRAIGIDGSILADFVRGDTTNIVVTPWMSGTETKGITLKFSDVYSNGQISLSPVYGHADKAGYLLDKLVQIDFDQIMREPVTAGFIANADAENSEPLMSLKFKNVDGQIAFVADATSWKNYCVGGLKEERENPEGQTPEYQGLYSFFWNEQSTPQNPLWLEFFEKRDLNVHTLLAQFDSSLLDQLSKTMRLYPNDVTYTHYLEKVGLTVDGEGRFPITFVKDAYSYRLFGENWPNLWIKDTLQVQTQMVSLFSESQQDGQPLGLNDGQLVGEQRVNVVSEEVLTRTLGDWIIDSAEEGCLFNGRIWSKLQDLDLQKILGIAMPKWLLNKTQLRLTGSYEIILKRDDMLKFSLPQGEWRFRLEYINA